jgi:hypothetical protein
MKKYGTIMMEDIREMINKEIKKTDGKKVYKILQILEGLRDAYMHFCHGRHDSSYL